MPQGSHPFAQTSAVPLPQDVTPRDPQMGTGMPVGPGMPCEHHTPRWTQEEPSSVSSLPLITYYFISEHKLKSSLGDAALSHSEQAINSPPT